jgi:hypothetical protein
LAVNHFLGFAVFATVSADGRMIASADPDKVVTIIDLRTGQQVLRIDKLPEAATAVALSPDCSTIAWSGGVRDFAIHLVEIASGKERMRLAGHGRCIRSLAFADDGTRLVSGSEDTTALIWDVTGAQDQPRRLSESELGTCWTDLAAEDARRRFVAVRRLAGSPDNAIAFLARRLRAVPLADEKQVAHIVADMDSPAFKVREGASRELAALGEPAAEICRKALRSNPPAEVRGRLEVFLKQISDQQALPWHGEQLRQVHALEVLERMATIEARRLVAEIAGGAPGAWLTGEARQVFERLERRK